MTTENGETNKPPQGQAYDLSKLKILIIEDFDFIGSILSASLQEMGIGEVLTAKDGKKGMNLISTYNNIEHNNNIDVVVLDWLMPKVDGATLLKWIRGNASDQIKFLPVIVCSAYASTDLVKDSRDGGATEVLVKPVSAEKIAHRIQTVIEKPRPFIKSPDFFGPDRRRQTLKHAGEDRRKTKPQEVEQHHEQY